MSYMTCAVYVYVYKDCVDNDEQCGYDDMSIMLYVSVYHVVYDD